MARTVVNPLVLAALHAYGGRPLAALADRGPAVVAAAIQTLYEQQTSCLVRDTAPGGGMVAPLHYRVKNQKREGVGAGGPEWRAGCRLFSSTGASASLYLDGDDFAFDAWGAPELAEHTLDAEHPDDSGEYTDASFEVSGDVDSLLGVRLHDSGARAALPAGPWSSGLVPQEAGRWAAELPVSVARTDDVIRMARSLLQRQAGQILASAKADGLPPAACSLQIPAPLVATRGGLEHTASLWVQGTGLVTVRTGLGTFSLAPSSALGTWAARLSVRDLCPEIGATSPPSVAAWEVQLGGDIYAASCYWDDLPEEAYP